MAEHETHEYDVVVIGAGGAGLRAAIEAHDRGARTALVCKSLLGKAHTVMAEGGIAAAMGNVYPDDNWRVHFRDTMRGGKMLNSWRMAQLHAQEAPDRVYELEEWGALFDRTDDGRILQRDFGGHRFARLAHVGDRTGLEMIRTLQHRAVALGIDVFMECTVMRLLTDDGRIAGAVAYWRESGRLILFKAKAVVLATGGIGKAWKITSNSWEYTGDGHALAYQAGADLIDMEFVQFHPTGMVWPPSVRGILVTEGVREGRGSPHGGVFLDIAWIREKLPDSEERIRKKLPSMYHQFKQLADIDITREPMEVGPTTHYVMGGVRVDGDTQMSTVPGLFAAGECAAGLHGANRLGGNSLSDLLVFGKRAGEYAAAFASENGEAAIDGAVVDDAARRALEPFERGAAGEGPFQIQAELQERMQELVGIVRQEDEMLRALGVIAELRGRAARVGVPGNREYNPGWHTALDLDNLLTVSEALIRAGIARKESRGAHFRDDYPDKDPAYSTFNYVLRTGSDGNMVMEKVAIPPIPPE